MDVRTDCRHYRVSAPCAAHKRTQASCPQCTDYSPVRERIAVVKLDAMGDVLRTTACLEPLKRLYPASHVTWITRTNAAALLEENPWIDRVLTVESNYLEFLLCEDFDLALGPDADPLSASIMRLLHATEKRGFVADGRGGVVATNAPAAAWWRMGLDDARKRANRRTYGEWLYDICELPGPVARPWLRPASQALEEARRFLNDRAPDAKRWVCFNTGASGRWEQKRWKAAHYRELAVAIEDAAPDTAILLVGGPGEAEFNSALLGSHAPFVDGGTANTVQQFAALIASCNWVVTPDSLGYHIACAVSTPALCLVGPTSPWELDLYGTNRVVHADLGCIACYRPKCPFTTTCMDALTPAAIWEQRYADSASLPISGVAAVPAHGLRTSLVPMQSLVSTPACGDTNPVFQAMRVALD